MRSVFITLIVILGLTVILFNVFQQYKLDKPVAVVRIVKGARLEPRVVTIPAGYDVSWENTTDSLYMVTSIPERSNNAHLLRQSTQNATFHIGKIQAGKSRSMTFYEPGRYLYVSEVDGGSGVATGIIVVEERE